MFISKKLVRTGFYLFGYVLLGFFPGFVTAQQDFSQVTIKTTQVTPGIYMLQGAGGNIGLSVGADGVFMIDDQFAPLSEKIQKAIAELTDQPVKFLINTHWHHDHTGGNEAFGEKGAVIISHENVRKRLLTGGRVEAFDMNVSPTKKEGLPVITFDREITFHWNDDTLEVLHVDPAHTDGDAVIFFKEANVIHTGDLYFNGFYPFIDGNSGGSLAGVIAAIEILLGEIDSDTKIIPGHGMLSNKGEMQSYLKMLKNVHKKMKRLKAKGKTVEQVVAAKPTAKYDKEWGKGFLGPDVWVRIVYPTI